MELIFSLRFGASFFHFCQHRSYTKSIKTLSQRISGATFLSHFDKYQHQLWFTLASTKWSLWNKLTFKEMYPVPKLLCQQTRCESIQVPRGHLACWVQIYQMMANFSEVRWTTDGLHTCLMTGSDSVFWISGSCIAFACKIKIVTQSLSKLKTVSTCKESLFSIW